MKLAELTTFLERRGLEPRAEHPRDAEIERVTENSKACGPATLFVAIRGSRADGHDYLGDAAVRGARFALVERDDVQPPTGMTLICVNDARRAAGLAAQAAAGHPSRAMDLIGVTGTNGKTTTVFLLEAIFRAAGLPSGVLSTVHYRWGEREEPANETTPSGPRIAELLSAMRDNGVRAAAMEVSSHAIDQRRVEGVRFGAMVLTNVTQDHLDYHATMEAYAETKKSIFARMRDENPEAVGVVNLDDPVGAELAERLAPANRMSYSLANDAADLYAESRQIGDAGIRMTLRHPGGTFEIASPLVCEFNAMNLLAAAGAALAIGIEPSAVAEGGAGFRGAPGRFELIDGLPGVRVVVDYAHTPDALRQLLINARTFAKGRLIVVFGCGGDRDRSKRPRMGRAVAELADVAIVTSDNPRTEDPQRIVDDILPGIDEAKTGATCLRHEGFGRQADRRAILDRRCAIAEAIETAREGDVVVIAGKGHEDYQILGTEKIHFDDREIAREVIRNLGRAAAGR